MPKAGVMLLMILMSTNDRPQPGKYVFIAVIFIAVLIDAVLFAHLRANFIHDHGYDIRPRHPAVAKPAPP
ncbi:hypothetical protein [Candidatus Binatus soli]|jgi:hypothetical protein|uniref:hypothetical protein n=1 Tax=Candidatus Binatus soli TaxID=1953413 RepID=UPI003D0DFFE2